MEDFIKKLKNFWFYYHKHLLIALAVVLAAGWLTLQDSRSPDPDYHIGLVKTAPCTEAELTALEERFTAAGMDVNGDGQVLVQIHTYYVDLADDSENAGVSNAEVVQALDADLIGGVSGIFLLEDVVTFQQVTSNMMEPVISSFVQELFIALRKDADSIYRDLMEKLF